MMKPDETACQEQKFAAFFIIFRYKNLAKISYAHSRFRVRKIIWGVPSSCKHKIQF